MMSLIRLWNIYSGPRNAEEIENFKISHCIQNFFKIIIGEYRGAKPLCRIKMDAHAFNKLRKERYEIFQLS